MAKLNWRDVGFLAEEVAEIHAIMGPDYGSGARVLAIAWCRRMKPGFDSGKFTAQVTKILRERGITA